MTKRKKAKSAPAQPAHGGHLLGPPRQPSTARASAAAPTVESPPSTTAAPSTTFALAAECLIAGASTLKQGLATLLDQPESITLDITALQRIDTAGLQVLASFVRERADHGRSVEWRGTAPALTSAAQLLGLTSLLGLPA